MLKKIILLLILGAVIYSNIIHAPFVFDDYGNIVDNVYIRNLSNIASLWDNYKTRFLAYASFALNYHFDQLRVEGYHIVNVMIHIFNALLVFFLVPLISRTPKLNNQIELDRIERAAFFGALIFLVHPLQTQAVTYIVQRITSLAAFFYLSTVFLYIKGRVEGKRVFLAAAFITLLAAMFTKENTVTLPVMLVVCEVMLFTSFKDKTMWLRLLPYLAAMALIPVFLYSGFVATGGVAGVTMETASITRWEYFLTQINVIRTYLTLLVFPVHQNVDYDFAVVQNVFNLPTLGSLALIGLLIFIGYKNIRPNRFFAIGIFWFFITLSVESSIIPVRDVIQEHRLYLPMFGFALCTSFAVNKIDGFGKKSYIALSVLALIFSFLTYQRNHVWSSPDLFWKDVIFKSPDKSRAYDNLASVYLGRGDYTQALEYLSKAVSLDPNNAQTHNNLGLVFMSQGHLDKAMGSFRRALDLDKNFVTAKNNIGTIYMQRSYFDQAARIFEEALTENPRLLPARLNLAKILAQENRFPQAIELAQTNLMFDPVHSPTLLELTQFYFLALKPQAAQAIAEQALRQSRDTQLLSGLGSVLAINGKYNQAYLLFARALILEENNAEIYLEFGKLLANLNKMDEAIDLWEQGRRLSGGDRRFQTMIDQAIILKDPRR